MIGKKFGMLKVRKRVGVDNTGKNSTWECKCDCGNLTVVTRPNLRTLHTISCGCMRPRHGNFKHPEYKIWKAMINRCTNKKNKFYSYYGGRGIRVCERWLHSFENFYADMGKRPENLTLERINNNLGYYPENCKWISRKKQSRNTRLYKNNTTGVKGISIDKRTGKFIAQITANLKNIYLGRFSTLKKATTARKEGELKYWGK